MNPLHIEFRPQSFDEFIGNELVVKSLLSSLNRTQTYLLHGQRGCGKTTLARLIAQKLKINKNDIYEIDAADKTGIDDARQLKINASLAPLSGNKKIYIIDECFCKKTKVKTIYKDKNIKDIKVGDIIFNKKGIDKVKSVFINKVKLENVMRIKINGEYTYCSKSHVYFSKYGEKKAQDLSDEDIVFKFNNYGYGGFYEKIRIDLQMVWKNFLCTKSNNKNLFKILYDEFKKSRKQFRNNWRRKLFGLQETFRNSFVSENSEKILFEKLSRRLANITTRDSSKNIYQGSEQKNKREIIEFAIGKEKRIGCCSVKKNERKQSYEQPINSTKNDENKKSKWNFKCLDGRKRRERKINRPSNTSCNSTWLANRSGDPNKSQSNRWEWLSNLLQSGHWKQKNANCCRGRWTRPFNEEKEKIGFKERKPFKEIRVESVEIYKQGNNDESFASVIGDKERNQGYVEFYDLEIEKHPSYFANNILVHNCHRLSGNAMDSLLKILEEPPRHCYFVLCTTDPAKVSVTIKSRSKMYEVKPLKDKDAFKLLDWICDEEKIKISDKVKDAIIDECKGIPREIVIALDSIRDIDDEDEAIELIQSEKENPQIIDLCRALLKKEKWSSIGAILKDLKDDPESIRYAVLGYMSSVLLNSSNGQAAFVIHCFSESFIYSKKAGLILSCFNSVLK